MTDLATNVLCYGDNLNILRRYLPDAAVDLVSLDPPAELTERLVASALQASEMGRPIYERLGFRTVVRYAAYADGP